MNILSTDQKERLSEIINLSWNILIEYVDNGKVKINKESSLQLHYAAILKQIGETFCIKPEEIFTVELETHYKGKNIDIFCSLGQAKAALEIKCFKEFSSTGGKSAAQDIKMYDVFEDICRLSGYVDEKFVDFGIFLCYTDHKYFVEGAEMKGYTKVFSTRNGSQYPKGVIKVPWSGWKDKSRDKDIILTRNIIFNWTTKKKHNFLLLPV